MSLKNQEISHMKLVLRTALKSPIDEIPMYAIIIDQNNNILSRSYNHSFKNKNRIDHAECCALKSLPQAITDDYTLYVSLEPCAMCYYACEMYGIKKIIYGIQCEKFGAFTKHYIIPSMLVINGLEKWPELYQEIHEYKLYLQNFFKKLRV